MATIYLLILLLSTLYLINKYQHIKPKQTNQQNKYQLIKFNNQNNEIEITTNIKLNAFIFSVVSFYLIQNNSYNYIFELSILSKTTFKLFQNLLISYEFNRKSFFLTKNQLLSYINNHNNNRQHQYNTKLIQYRSLESIKLYFYENEEDKLEHLSIGFNELTQIKKEFNNNCPQLKQVAILDFFKSNPNEERDYTHNGFFVFKRLMVILNIDDPPYSINEQQLIFGTNLPQQPGIQEQEDDDYDDNSEHFDQILNYPYSFKYIENYKPIRIFIESEWHCYHKNINNLLNCKSIKSIVFLENVTPDNFIVEALKSTHIKSLSIKLLKIDQLLSLFKNYYNNTTSANTTIQKLIINNIDEYELSENKDQTHDNQQYISNVLEIILKSLPSLKSLSLNSFKITNVNSLSPLLTIENSISKLQCNVINLQATLDHCNLNKQITNLQVYVEDMNYDNDDKEFFKNYINDKKLTDTIDYNTILLKFSTLNTSNLQYNLYEEINK